MMTMREIKLLDSEKMHVAYNNILLVCNRAF